MRFIFFSDTPLLSHVTAVESCLLQTRLFGHNDCVVSRQQDLHTRRRQDLAFQALADELNDAAVYDPVPVLFGAGSEFDPVAPDGSLRMMDWHHLTVASAHALADDFRKFLRTNGWPPLQARLSVPSGSGQNE